jgi:hypothetical protein
MERKTRAGRHPLTTSKVRSISSYHDDNVLRETWLMKDTLHLTRWHHTLALALLLLCSAATAQAQAEYTGNTAGDLPLLEASLAETIQAAASGKQDSARLAMETLFHNWRRFRQRNIEGHPEDKAFVTDLEAIEQRLFAASLAVDKENLPDARAELEAARLLLLAVQQRYPAPPS